MKTYNISAETTPAGILLRLSFGTPAQNSQIVRDAVSALEELKLQGGHRFSERSGVSPGCLRYRAWRIPPL